MNKLANKVAVVTGASKGIGAGIAKSLAAEGAAVVVNYASSKEDAERVVAEITGQGGKALAVQGDVSKASDVQRLFAETKRAFGKLDVLVNNAGIGFGAPGEARQVSADGHELRFAVNYLAPVLLTRLLVPLLTASAPSRIVNVGSLGQVPFDPADAGFEHGYNGVDAYRRSKLALAAFTFALAGELDPAKVTVNCLHPATFMNTAMVTRGGITPVSTVEQGGEATMRLITDPSLDGVTGQFFDGLNTARALPQAYDPQFRAELDEVTGQMIGQAP